MPQPAQTSTAAPESETPVAPLSLDHVPPAPRRPSARAKRLVFRYQGAQKILLLCGVIFMAAGLPLGVVFTRGVGADLYLSANGSRTGGTVISVREVTNVTVNDEHPWEVRFAYQRDGRQLEGVSSTTDTSIIEAMAPGTGVNLEVAGEYARVEDTHLSVFGPFGLFALVFPLLGAWLVFFAVRGNRREISAFTHGVPARANITFAGYDGSTEMNGRHPFKVAWEFAVQSQRFEGSLSSMEASDLSQFAGAPELVVLYRREDPRINTAYIE